MRSIADASLQNLSIKGVLPDHGLDYALAHRSEFCVPNRRPPSKRSAKPSLPAAKANKMVKPGRSAGARPNAEAQIRIGAGQWRSRVVRFPEADGLRPTGSRIRETLFNWLAPELPGSRCLDAFSGSGILGFEALSRGAASAVLLEPNAMAHQAIVANANLLHASGAEVHCQQAQSFLAQKPAQSPFDIVFIDPPFALDLWPQVIGLLNDNHWLSERAVIYVETPKSYVFQAPLAWQLEKSKQAGNVTYALYRRQ